MGVIGRGSLLLREEVPGEAVNRGEVWVDVLFVRFIPVMRGPPCGVR